MNSANDLGCSSSSSSAPRTRSRRRAAGAADQDLIGKTTWRRAGVDVKGDAYEELLSRSASDVKSGAGQYFTPRP